MRIGFLVDGFNLYHSLKDYQAFRKICVKWLDIHSLCNSYISEFGKDARITSIYYFSAHAKHRIKIKKDPDVINRHQTYIRALKTIKIKGDRYEKHQFVPSITASSGKIIKKPKSW